MTDKKRMNLISHHGLVLLYISKKPQVTYRELSRLLDLTERHVTRIVHEMTDSGVLSYKRSAKGNIYKKTARVPQHGVPKGIPVKQVLDRLGPLAG